jgi:hypothetical protein
MADSNSAIFIDTSVQLLRFMGRSDVKRQIDLQLKSHGFTVTSLIVRQEFKRRFLSDVKYVRDALVKCKLDCGETLRYINQKLGLPVNRRKLSICINIFSEGVFNGRLIPNDGECFKLLLDTWLDFGLAMFDDSVGQVVRYSECGCGKSDRLGPQKCKSTDRCEIDAFIRSRNTNGEEILSFLREKSKFPKTKEIEKAEQTLSRWLKDAVSPSSTNPCLNVGDLIISMESAGVPTFYTQNARESQHFCCVNNQTMIVHREEGDVTCQASNCEAWPHYA